MSHRLVRQLQKEAIAVKQSCRLLCISRSGYYEAQRFAAKPTVCKASAYLNAWQRHYANHAEAKNDIADYIVGFYNCQRLRSALDNLLPIAYEQKMATQYPIKVSEIT